ncbi:hypothetical protein [Pedobacter cryoconitis]|uniref:YD repeat-containing protein n=1 Tax=Pedobacter cryoconitis TaxID=188932 RepID=A0A7X0JA73_9SPHI|nr:hypothetical protein [Pedobacter cryoconitis]MBB6502631.1 YD repeat-containing protein [Pedobacter cryoconitis]
MKKTLLFFLFFYCCLFKLYAQVLPQTPNAAELGRYGQVPTELFNGLPQITIPIHTVKVKDIVVPIQMSYYASGIKVQQHPTWVGLGWSLSCGGSITRVIHGAKDEKNSEDVKRESNYGFNVYGFGYFYRSNNLDRTDWLSLASFTNFFPSGATTQSNYADGEPDEFIVNAPGVNASFYLYRDVNDSIQVKVKSKDGRKIRVKTEIANLNVDFFSPSGQTNNETKETLYGPFYKFTVTAEDGKIYTFGGAVDAIEFNSAVNDSYRNTIPVTWYLTSIKGISGGQVNFTYQRDGNPIVSNSVKSQLCVSMKDKPETYACSFSGQGTSISVQYPIYLAGVSGSDGTQIDFTKSQTVELKDDTDTIAFYRLTHINPKTYMPQNHWMKLDGILINNSKSVKFNYTSNASERLKLNSLSISDLYNNNPGSYKFSYNPTLLPGYNSKMADNWGYYNGKSYDGITGDKLYQYRSADTSLMKAEVLRAISYPTGGKTFFEYEAHDYSKIASQLPDFNLQTASGIAGGLRIRRVISRPDANSAEGALIKEYSYLNEDNTSSGMLSGIPLYSATGHARVEYHTGGWSGLTYYSTSAKYEQNYTMTSENFMNLLGNTNGNHITYSRVIEKTSGNGKVIYKYTNHDQFPDQAPLYTNTNVDQRTLTDDFTSRELERGLLLSQQTYDENNKLLETVTNEYNSSPDRYNDFVKSISKMVVPGLGSMPFIRMNANVIYTFYPYLQKKTITSYTGLSISKTEQYSYDSKDNTLSSLVAVDSKGQTSTTTYSYPGNMRDSAAVYKAMYDVKHITSPVIKEIKTITKAGANTVIPSYFKRTNYSEVGAGVFMPGSVDQSIGSYPVETLTSYTYDNKGNLSTKSTGNGPFTSYVWGYADQFPVAIIENANGASSGAVTSTKYFNYVLPESNGSGSSGFTSNVLSDMKLDINAQPGFTYTLQYTLSGAGVYKSGNLCISRTSKGCNFPSTAVFNNMPPGSYTLSIGTVGPDPSGTYRSITLQYMDKQIAAKGTNEFFYDGFEETGNVNVVNGKGHTGYKYWDANYPVKFSPPAGRNYIIQWWNYANSKWNFNQQAYSANLTLTGPVDDVRIFPEDAKMTTYTYDPQVGMTSHTDEKGQSFYYEYDGIQRLIKVKDQNGDLIRSNSYHFKN